MSLSSSSTLCLSSPAGPTLASPQSTSKSIPPSEILEVIFMDLARSILSSDSGTPSLIELRAVRAWLRAAALTCQDFCSVALDVLWQNLDNLTPLLQLLPSFKEQNRVHIISQPISSSDWARFDCYARRVRRVAYRTDSPSIEIHPSVYTALSILHPSILPNLESVAFPSSAASSPNSFPDAILLAGAAVRRVELTSQADPSFVSLFLATLAGTSPQLTSFKLSGQSFAVLEHTLSTFHELEILELRYMADRLSSDVFRSIAALKHLRSFSIHFSPLELFPVPFLRFTPANWTPSFAALKSLHIRCTIANSLSINKLYFCIPDGALQVLTITIEPGPLSVVQTLSEQLFRDMAARWASSLQRLDLYDFGMLSRHHYDEFLKLRNLKTFRARNTSLPIDVAEIPIMTAAWPHIRSLSLPLATGLTIDSLRHFAQNCPNLTDLEVTILTLDLPAFTTTPVCRHPLRVLNVGDSPCPAATWPALARNLDRLFPRLRSLRASGNDRNRWAEVEALLFVLQDVRLHAVAQS
ncbi:hypothetical protein K438DRAFT_2030589 [Mycena galopus ATCC 62051]|nr:hypothetical protein K438DRAFT_2030589 [Mycena galopus ATCC 62051]